MAALGTSPEPAATSTSTDWRRDLDALLDLRSRIVGQLPDSVRGHFNVSEDDITQLADAAKAAAAAGTAGGEARPAVSVISLESVGGALEEDADWEDWLASVMRLLLGYPTTLQLPRDRLGNPDFADAW